MQPHEPKKKRGNGVVHISNLFQKYSTTLKAPQGIVLNAFIYAVEEVCAVHIIKTQCRYDVRKKTIILNTSGMLKTEILLKKKDVLTVMEEVVGKENTPTTLL